VPRPHSKRRQHGASYGGSVPSGFTECNRRRLRSALSSYGPVEEDVLDERTSVLVDGGERNTLAESPRNMLVAIE